MYLGSKHFCQVDFYTYLEHYITSNLLHDKDILRQIQASYILKASCEGKALILSKCSNVLNASYSSLISIICIFESML